VNRLAVRLALAVSGVVVFAILVVVVAQFSLVRRQFLALPANVRAELEATVGDRDLTAGERSERLERAVVAWLADPEAREAVVEALAAVRRPEAQVGFAVAALASVVLGVGVAAAIAGRIARPITAVARAAGRVAGGDLTARVAAGPTRGRRPPDEVALLARSFDAMAAELERSERQRRTLVADVAHELRTPVSVLRGRLEAILDGVLPLDRDEVARLHRQSELLARLVEDLRVLSLADDARLELDLQEVDLVALAREVLVGFDARGRGAGVRLEFVAALGELRQRVDRHRVAQVLTNLIDNALRVTPPGGAVGVEVVATAGGSRVVVRDDGPGLPPGDPERLFERFYRAEESRTRATGGSGLGLPIARTLVAAHGGRLRAEPGDAGGARFVVELEAPT
jgi:signal transduction histidine kinase